VSMIPDAHRGEVVVFQSTDGAIRVDVRLTQETVWLSLDQMAALFGRHKSVISRHLRNVFASKELKRSSVVAKNATTAPDGKSYDVEFFSLDAILSVGYRVNSRRGTQFRIWATRTVRDHLLHGYTLHERRLRELGLREAREAVDLLARTLTTNALVTDEGQAVVDVVHHYARTWHWLFEYDEDRLTGAPEGPVATPAPFTLDEARGAIESLREALGGRGEAGVLFGRERDGALAGILGAIEQTWDRQPLYRTAQERAAHLLYFIVKDHPFSDGNKRIGALLFLECLRRNGLLVRPDGRLRLADTATAALTLLIAESRPAQKDLMVRLVMSLLGDADASRGASTIAEPRVAYGGRRRSDAPYPEAFRPLVRKNDTDQRNRPAATTSSNIVPQRSASASASRPRSRAVCAQDRSPRTRSIASGSRTSSTRSSVATCSRPASANHSAMRCASAPFRSRCRVRKSITFRASGWSGNSIACVP